MNPKGRLLTMPAATYIGSRVPGRNREATTALPRCRSKRTPKRSTLAGGIRRATQRQPSTRRPKTRPMPQSQISLTKIPSSEPRMATKKSICASRASRPAEIQVRSSETNVAANSTPSWTHGPISRRSSSPRPDIEVHGSADRRHVGVIVSAEKGQDLLGQPIRAAVAEDHEMTALHHYQLAVLDEAMVLAGSKRGHQRIASPVQDQQRSLELFEKRPERALIRVPKIADERMTDPARPEEPEVRHDLGCHDEQRVARGILQVLQVIVPTALRLLHADPRVRHDRGHPLRFHTRHVVGHTAAHRVTDQMRPLDSETIHELEHVARMGLDPVIRNPVRRSSKAGQVRGENPVTRGQVIRQAARVPARPGAAVQINHDRPFSVVEVGHAYRRPLDRSRCVLPRNFETLSMRPGLAFRRGCGLPELGQTEQDQIDVPPAKPAGQSNSHGPISLLDPGRSANLDPSLFMTVFGNQGSVLGGIGRILDDDNRF